MPTASSSMADLLAPMPARDAPGPAPVRFRGGGFGPRVSGPAALAAFVLAIAGWQALVSFGIVSPVFLPSPVEVATALVELARTGRLWDDLSISLYRIGIGWTLGTLCGVAAGTAMALFSLARSVGVPLVSALFPIPKIALLPLLILWLGIGETSKVATIALGVFFPTAIAAYTGIDNVPRSLIRMAQSFDVPFASIVRTIALPGALPSVLAGMRISASIALLLVVSAEMIGAERGIGAFVLSAGNLMQTDQLMAGVTVLSCLGLAVGTTLSRLEKALLGWR
jgi:ABC-type nitrate/sulfonate/bicarbonate transport system permease component